MEERSNKTIMCSVLFLDIVEYSKMSVSGQISLKDRFNSYLSAAIRDVPLADRIILDTGDGAAINFLGDVEDALKAALSLRESILNEDPGLNPPLLVRAGINLGPVRLVRDINGQPNIVGDGINVAQRVMGFADADQILVSRSYYDAVSRLSPEYAGMFSYQGSRTDKHVREHEVYAIGHLGEKTADLIATNLHEVQLARFVTSVRESWNAVISRLGNVIKNFRSRFEQADRRQRAIYAGAIAVPVVLIGVLVLTLGGRDEMPAQPDAESLSAASGIEPVPAAAPAAPVEPVAPVADSKTAETSPAQPAAVSKPDAKKTAGSKPSPKKPAGSTADSKKTSAQPAIDQPASDQPAIDQPGQTDAPRKSTATESADKKGWLDTIIGDDAARQGAPAHIAVRCIPGTEVFVDGTQKGKIISRMLVVDVPAGKHTVIVTSTSGEVYSQTVELAAGRTANIRPGFCN